VGALSSRSVYGWLSTKQPESRLASHAEALDSLLTVAYRASFTSSAAHFSASERPASVCLPLERYRRAVPHPQGYSASSELMPERRTRTDQGCGVHALRPRRTVWCNPCSCSVPRFPEHPVSYAADILLEPPIILCCGEYRPQHVGATDDLWDERAPLGRGVRCSMRCVALSMSERS
jgi:hypothetical protein